ncbi:MAG: YqzL family protein [Alicyclobacillaceae bacterium]|nr:YqzL family protein [Alicyclobacillaceae bacterium]
MREFSWRCFLNTGSIDAYLLYKQFQSAIQSATDREGRRTDPPPGEGETGSKE